MTDIDNQTCSGVYALMLTPQGIWAGVGQCQVALLRQVSRGGCTQVHKAVAIHGLDVDLDGALSILVSKWTVASQLCRNREAREQGGAGLLHVACESWHVAA
jgi:hypothetical protein